MEQLRRLLQLQLDPSWGSGQRRMAHVRFPIRASREMKNMPTGYKA